MGESAVLLAEWVRRVRHPVAWLSLDAADNDPARFWRHAVAALDRVRPGISERMGPLLGPPPAPSFEPLVTALINEVAGQPDAEEALLVLDDYHVISSRLVHESLGFLLEHRPPGLHLALTSRSDPPLALARLRARGQLTELRAAELRFTPGEAAAQHRAGSLIEISALRALALAASGDADDAVDALAGALTLACPRGYVRVFADEGPPMAALVTRLIATQRAGSGRQFEPGYREPARGDPRHREEARQPRPGQARRGQPHRGRRPRPRAQPDSEMGATR